MRKRAYIITFVCCILLLHVTAQVKKPIDHKTANDSISLIIRSAKTDTAAINALLNWDNIIFVSDPSLDMELNKRVLDICVNAQKQNGLSAKMKHYFKDKQAFALNNIGLVYNDKSIYSDAIRYFSKSLKIREQLKDDKGRAACLNNIGLVYKDNHEQQKAIHYFRQACNIMYKKKDEVGLATTLNNIGIIYQEQNDPDSAIIYYDQSLEYSNKIGFKSGLARTFNNLGLIYLHKKDYDKALDYSVKGYEIRKSISDRVGIAMSLNTLALLYNDIGQYSKAEKYAKESVALSEEVDGLFEKQNATLSLYLINKGRGDYKQALDYYIKQKLLQDSISRQENQKALIEQQFRSAYEKKATADSVKNVNEVKIKDAEIQKEKTQRYALYAGLAVLMLLSAFIYRSFVSKKRDNRIIEQQKKILEQQQKEVLDSIHYAKRIQEALLPSQKSIQRAMTKLKNEKKR